MKALSSEHKMRTKDVKVLLDIPWGELSNHLKSLEEKGFVELIDEFTQEGQVVQTVYVLEAGRREFEELYGILKQFTADESPMSDLLGNRKLDNQRDPLYPE